MDLFNEIRPIAMADATAVYHPAPDLGGIDIHRSQIMAAAR